MKSFLCVLIAMCSFSVFAGVTSNLDDIKGEMPGCAVGVLSDGTLIYEEYRGFASIKYDVPIDHDTIFNIGSITKHITAAVFFQLEKKGLFKRTDPLSKYYPDGPEWFQVVKLGQLINHTSGLPDYLNDEAFSAQVLATLLGDTDLTLASLRGQPLVHGKVVSLVLGELFKLDPPLVDAEAKAVYSNTGFLLLTDIIDKHSDRSFKTWAQELIFEPAGMEKTYIHGATTLNLKWLATGYKKPLTSGEPYSRMSELLHSYGDGGVLTSLRDFSKWLTVLSQSSSKASIWHGFLVDSFGSGASFFGENGYYNGLIIQKYSGLVYSESSLLGGVGNSGTIGAVGRASLMYEPLSSFLNGNNDQGQHPLGMMNDNAWIYSHSGFSLDGMRSEFWLSPKHNVGYIQFCNFDFMKKPKKFDVFFQVANFNHLKSAR